MDIEDLDFFDCSSSDTYSSIADSVSIFACSYRCSYFNMLTHHK